MWWREGDVVNLSVMTDCVSEIGLFVLFLVVYKIKYHEEMNGVNLGGVV